MNADSIEAARKNWLLRGLPRSTVKQMAQDLDLRQMRVRDRVVRKNGPIDGVYFPLSCVLSTVAEGAKGEIVEVATVGNEGMAGLSVFLGVDRSTTLETFAQIAGESLWMRAREFRDHLKNNGPLTQVMGHYTQALLTQISQAAACNRMHAAEERCARWLLMTLDRVGRDSFELTQEFLAQMLGVRRATVSEVAASLQAASLIQYTRGTITVLNRTGLEERSCECYRIIHDEYARLLPLSRD